MLENLFFRFFCYLRIFAFHEHAGKPLNVGCKSAGFVDGVLLR